MRTFEMVPGHQTPDSLRGRAKPLSLRRAFTTPPKPPKIEIKEAHHQGFILSPSPARGALCPTQQPLARVVRVVMPNALSFQRKLILRQIKYVPDYIRSL